MLVTILGILAGMFGLTSAFLAKELLKKFRLMADFSGGTHDLITWEYPGSPKPGMRKIVLRAKYPMGILVGFRLEIPIIGDTGFDYYGFVQMNAQGVAVISTYLGRGKCEFLFFANMNTNTNPIEISSTDDDQTLTPSVTYPPHWFQRFGPFG